MQPAVLAAGFSWFYFLLIGLNRKYKGESYGETLCFGNALHHGTDHV